FASAEEKETRRKAFDELHAKISPLRNQVTQIDAPYRETLSKAKRLALEPKYKEALDTPAEKRTEAQKVLAGNALILQRVTWDEILAAMSAEDRAKRVALREQIHVLEARMPPPTAAAWTIKNEGPGQTF